MASKPLETIALTSAGVQTGLTQEAGAAVFGALHLRWVSQRAQADKNTIVLTAAQLANHFFSVV